VCLPAHGYHVPVGFVAVHGDLHPPASAGNAVIRVCARIDVPQELLERKDVFESGGLPDIAAVQQDVDPDPRHLFLERQVQQHGSEVVEVTVHVAVGEEPDEMKRPAVRLGEIHQAAPTFALENPPRSDGFIDQLRPLRKEPPGPDGVVPHLGVAHVRVGRQSHGGAVSLEQGMRAVLEQPVQIRGVCLRNRIAELVFAISDAVHHHEDQRFRTVTLAMSGTCRH